jgi:hypothetical protein
MKTLTPEHAKEIVESVPYLKSRLDPKKISGDTIFHFDFLSPEKERLVRLAESVPVASIEINQLPQTNPQMHFLKMYLKETHTIESLINRFEELRNIAKSCGINEVDEVGVGIV